MSRSSKYSFSATGIDLFLWDMRKSAWGMVDDPRIADRAIEPIVWYIRTGRASSDFIRALLLHRPSTIAKQCLKCTTCDESIASVKRYLHL